MNRGERAVVIAMDLRKLGVSSVRVVELLTFHDHEVIERQLAFLPYRKATRPAAFIIEAIRGDYSAPKEFFYAQVQAHAAQNNSVDKDPERNPGPTSSHS